MSEDTKLAPAPTSTLTPAEGYASLLIGFTRYSGATDDRVFSTVVKSLTEYAEETAEATRAKLIALIPFEFDGSLEKLVDSYRNQLSQITRLSADLTTAKATIGELVKERDKWKSCSQARSDEGVILNAENDTLRELSHEPSIVLPEGHTRVTIGTTEAKDLCWNRDLKAWIPVNCIGDYVNEYHAVARPVPADPNAVAPGHNPRRLTNAQVGVEHGWRLLRNYEIVHGSKALNEIELWLHNGSRWSEGYSGCTSEGTYRTKLSPEALRAVRGL